MSLCHDYLACTECGATTDVTAQSLADRMGKTKRGTPRRGTRWIKRMTAIGSQWRCDDCLTRFEAEQ